MNLQRCSSIQWSGSSAHFPSLALQPQSPTVWRPLESRLLRPAVESSPDVPRCQLSPPFRRCERIRNTTNECIHQLQVSILKNRFSLVSLPQNNVKVPITTTSTSRLFCEEVLIQFRECSLSGISFTSQLLRVRERRF